MPAAFQLFSRPQGGLEIQNRAAVIGVVGRHLDLTIDDFLSGLIDHGLHVIGDEGGVMLIKGIAYALVRETHGEDAGFDRIARLHRLIDSNIDALEH